MLGIDDAEWVLNSAVGNEYSRMGVAKWVQHNGYSRVQQNGYSKMGTAEWAVNRAEFGVKHNGHK